MITDFDLLDGISGILRELNKTRGGISASIAVRDIRKLVRAYEEQRTEQVTQTPADVA